MSTTPFKFPGTRRGKRGGFIVRGHEVLTEAMNSAVFAVLARQSIEFPAIGESAEENFSEGMKY